MKVTIEIDLPEGQDIPTSQDIARLTDPDWMASWWHISDIHECADGWEGDEDEHELTNEEAQKVLRLMDKYHDCEVGICWDVIYNWIEEVKSHRKEVA
jgi:hypothetical protein